MRVIISFPRSNIAQSLHIKLPCMQLLIADSQPQSPRADIIRELQNPMLFGQHVDEIAHAMRLIIEMMSGWDDECGWAVLPGKTCCEIVVSLMIYSVLLFLFCGDILMMESWSCTEYGLRSKKRTDQ